MLKSIIKAGSYAFVGAIFLWHLAHDLILNDISFSCNTSKKILLRTLVGTLFILFYFFCPSPYWPSYLVFVGASSLVIYTDALSMLIARYTSIYLVPVAWVFAYHNGLYISFLDSIGGALLGIAILGSVQKLSELYYGQAGLGTGDIDYLALAGAFTGCLGVWLTLMLGSFLASIWALSLMVSGTFTRTTPFPFGSFLATAGILVLLFKYQIAAFLM